MLQGTRTAASPYEIALSCLLHDTEYPADIPPEIVEGVEAALATFEVEGARLLFDACLLGRASAEELAEAFRVSPEEATAYSTLFFDRDVFHNDFLVIAWIGRLENEPTRLRLQEAHIKGFRALRFEYAALKDSPSAAQALEQILEADARAYMKQQHIPLGDPRSKELRVLGKQVQASAQALVKVSAPVKGSDAPGAEDASGEGSFVIKPRPANPTLEELVARGISVVS
jgi:hypothetical protein